jgi:hypothetical protein
MATLSTSFSAGESPEEQRPYQAARVILAPTLAAHGFVLSAEEYEPNRFDSECANYVRADITLRMMYEGRDRRFVAETVHSGEAFNVCYTSDSEAFDYGVQNWVRTIFPLSETQNRLPEPQDSATRANVAGKLLKACAVILVLVAIAAAVQFAATQFTGARGLILK